MICTACRAENPTSQKFCGQCGARLEKICADCGATNPMDYNFCGTCGQGLDEVGHFTINPNGIVIDVNSRGATLLGLQKEAIIGKPITLFIAQEDIVQFFVSRNEAVSLGSTTTCELKLQKGDKHLDVQVECALDDSMQSSRYLRLAITDMTEPQRMRRALQSRHDLDDLFICISGDMIRCASREMDVALDRSLKIIGLYAEIDHCCLWELARGETELSITHQWQAPGTGNGMKKQTRVRAAEIDHILSEAKGRGKLLYPDTKTLSAPIQAEISRLSLPGTASFACFAMTFGDTFIGLISFGALSKKTMWDNDMGALHPSISDIFLNAIIRQRDSKAWQEKRKEAVKTRHTAPRPAKRHPSAIDLEGTLEMELAQTPAEQESSAASSAKKPERGFAAKIGWQFQKQPYSAKSNPLKIYERGGMVLITCPNCGRRKELSFPEIRGLGKTINAKCPCTYDFVATLELRTAFRKQVELEGHFIKKRSGKTISESSASWGNVLIKNISRKGIGFIAGKGLNIATGDILAMRFNLDNASQTAISKSVSVKSVRGEYVACQFTETDKHDVTIGFYMM